MARSAIHGVFPTTEVFPPPHWQSHRPPREEVQADGWESRPRVPEAGQRLDPAREERPRGPRSPLTRMPPAAAAATAPAAPPRAGHVPAGHAVARSVGRADSEGPRVRGRFCPAGQGRPLLSEFRDRVVPGPSRPGGRRRGLVGNGTWRLVWEGRPSLLPGMQYPGRGFWDQVFSLGGEAGKEEQNRFL